MAVVPIIEVPDPRLRAISTPVEVVDDSVRALIDDMFDSMYAARGIGLAAVQIGVPKRLIVMDLQEEEDAEGKPIKAPRVFINPEIFDPSDDHSLYTEGCLSVPDQYADVERPARCRVKWLDADSAAHDEVFEGLLATCIQHEMDHLQGIVFIDHLSRLKREMILKKLAKARKAAA
ncbi:peptide deformylase [Sphingomonas sp. GlSt437]|uniref:peptide deformylase n=1 Tax=Sphingomonas sp. GlSt437 TaxID=3389970 RepID=UPI003A87882A